MNIHTRFPMSAVCATCHRRYGDHLGILCPYPHATTFVPVDESTAAGALAIADAVIKPKVIQQKERLPAEVNNSEPIDPCKAWEAVLYFSRGQ